MKVQDILTDESKWCKGKLLNNLGQRCLVGAIDAAYKPVSVSALEEVMSRVRAVLQIACVSYWNDRPERTFAEVHDLIVELDI